MAAVRALGSMPRKTAVVVPVLLCAAAVPTPTTLPHKIARNPTLEIALI
jgi:hypothetical protein